VTIRIADVSVRLAGHTVLEEINLELTAGRHIALIGPSGAGKSTLAGLLLGWHRPATGEVWVNGAPLRGPVLDRLRRETAWVDPAVQLWNRSLRDNLTYGTRPMDEKALVGDSSPIGQIIDQAELRSVLEALPQGLETPLGEGGALVSGGEGQRVRLGRALLRREVRLALLDEPFRGLDRDTRRRLLAQARTLWRDAALLCITHDVGETLSFDQVLILDRGRIVEAGPPSELASQRGSRYRAMLNAEAAVRKGLWSGAEWRRLRLKGGRLVEQVQGD
jgi:ATP-binding cassette subfamily B protein